MGSHYKKTVRTADSRGGTAESTLWRLTVASVSLSHLSAMRPHWRTGGRGGASASFLSLTRRALPQWHIRTWV
ncbi:hypothetical protein JZ751_004083 [Albula glossodonta]|uniref:Uncharacterized protein n=1 Tax=Albula glossodonta TaxID=121402 RepID=A0A8T2PEZ7_9TELE|nr:hypothetical protein JZ751_004083 [Albula glossodonta]